MIPSMGIIIRVLAILLPIGVLSFQQSDYKVIFERVEIVSYNTTYFKYAKSHNFKYNRTNAVMNLTFELLYDFTKKLNMEVQAYRLASNEYRLFPLRFSFDFCNYATRNEFGLGELYKCGNLSDCPIKKGIRRICNWATNGSKFPSHVPAGSYMLDLKLFYRNTEMIFLQLYATAKYPEIKGFPIN